ncbi:MAG: CFI-box-CTERM domain-containing protein [Treponema sp.]
MLTKRINYKGICYPIAALYNRDKQFIGYLMPRAVGKELQKSIFIKPLLLKIFPTWQKRDTVELCLTILDKIKYLHDRNIILGDINPLNIMVKSPKEVYFVDTDSYQIEDFPCPVGTINYPAPEIQGKQYSEFLRTMGNENFAVATLLFMIMLPGKPPYSQQGGENPINNIKNMDFSYPFGDNSNKKTPDGPWRYIWSHLTYDLKEAFYTTFRKGEEHSTENTRLAVEQWIALFKYYQYLLDSGKFGEQDKMSEAIFPTRHKKNSNINYITCRLCQEEMPEEQCRNGICQACLNDGEEYKCKKCGEKLKFTNYHKYIKKTQKYDYCKNCFETELNRISYFTCVDCGKNFSLSQKEINFYSSKGYELPKRCKVCRDAKKNNNTVQNNNCSSQNHSLSRYSSGSSDCFITTAICEYLGKSDDCYELSLLRSYRDSWLQTQPEGMELITEYYDRAPTIVEKLKTSDKYTEYCKLLWNDYLLPCIKLIETNNYQDSLNLYRKMVTDISILLLSA